MAATAATLPACLTAAAEISECSVGAYDDTLPDYADSITRKRSICDSAVHHLMVLAPATDKFDGYVALDVIRRFGPDFVLLDLGLPGMDGFQVCEQITSDPDLRGIQVPALTA